MSLIEAGLCGCVYDADGRVAIYCSECQPQRTEVELHDLICRHISKTCRISVSKARNRASGWEVEVAPGVWRRVSELLTNAAKAA